MRSRARDRWLAVVLVLVAGCVVPAGADTTGAAGSGVGPPGSAASAAGDRSPARCGRDDTPETGIQGDVPLTDQRSGRAAQGYNCGLAVVGYDDLGGQGGGDMAWSRDCAYVRSRAASRSST